jgi:hypothetical protein
VDTARVRELAGLSEALVEAGSDVVRVVDPFDVDPRVGVAMLVVGADYRRHEAVEVLVDGRVALVARTCRLIGWAGRHRREG